MQLDMHLMNVQKFLRTTKKTHTHTQFSKCTSTHITTAKREECKTLNFKLISVTHFIITEVSAK